MALAKCGWVLPSSKAQPPDRPCPEASRLLDKFSDGGFTVGAQYLRHMRAAWQNLSYPKSVAIGDFVFETTDTARGDTCS